MGLIALVTKATIRRLGLSCASCNFKSYQCRGSYSLHFQPCYQYYTYCLSVITCSPVKAGQGICLTHTNWPTGCVCKVFILLLFPWKHGVHICCGQNVRYTTCNGGGLWGYSSRAAGPSVNFILSLSVPLTSLEKTQKKA